MTDLPKDKLTQLRELLDEIRANPSWVVTEEAANLVAIAEEVAKPLDIEEEAGNRWRNISRNSGLAGKQ